MPEEETPHAYEGNGSSDRDAGRAVLGDPGRRARGVLGGPGAGRDRVGVRGGGRDRLPRHGGLRPPGVHRHRLRQQRQRVRRLRRVRRRPAGRRGRDPGAAVLERHRRGPRRRSRRQRHGGARTGLRPHRRLGHLGGGPLTRDAAGRPQPDPGDRDDRRRTARPRLAHRRRPAGHGLGRRDGRLHDAPLHPRHRRRLELPGRAVHDGAVPTRPAHRRPRAAGRPRRVRQGVGRPLRRRLRAHRQQLHQPGQHDAGPGDDRAVPRDRPDEVRPGRQADPRPPPAGRRVPDHPRRRLLARRQPRPGRPAVVRRHVHGRPLHGAVRQVRRRQRPVLRHRDAAAGGLREPPPAARRPDEARVRRVEVRVVGGPCHRAGPRVLVPRGRLVRRGRDRDPRPDTGRPPAPGAADRDRTQPGPRHGGLPGPGERTVVPGRGQGRQRGQLDRDVVLGDVHADHRDRDRPRIRTPRHLPVRGDRGEGRRTGQDLPAQRRPDVSDDDFGRHERRGLHLLRQSPPGHQRPARAGSLPLLLRRGRRLTRRQTVPWWRCERVRSRAAARRRPR
ncbi:hypothetical protein SBRY_40345 [Actinacidiphila bryophytorum]|uniref:Uncharacterized protein n=1 Tax=Actinacidiphila bryophytorum TaxID=1436133 RepID=A0A9W4H2Q6_9ACTN|nr:hypothetical protein SBRY_40345 [Actinacidiphila bryophytorum]